MPAEGTWNVSPDSTEPKRFVIVTGGAPLLPAAVQSLPGDAFVIAADGGLDHALAAGLRADLVVGDMDSVSPTALAAARADGVQIEQCSPDKDSTDTELAIAAARARGASDICLIAGDSYRLDHTIGALAALGHPSLAACDSLEARWGPALVRVLHGPRQWTVATDREPTFSLLALHGECSGVTLSGARWPLSDATITPGSSLGISNVSIGRELRLAVASGVLTFILPDCFGGAL
jgi:thiamine pyrophosphokinase